MSSNGEREKTVVGVLTARKGKEAYPLPRGREARIYREMIDESVNRGVVLYYFYPDGLQWDRKKVLGHCYEKGAWVRKSFPWPDIVYNRIVYRSIEQQSQVRALLRRLSRESGMILFNSRFLDKWEVYDALRSDTYTSAHLPATELYQAGVLQAYLDSYEEVFLKPRNANTGKGIIKILRAPGNKFYYALAAKQALRWKKAESISDLIQQLSCFSLEQKTYMIQQGISLAQYNERVFDLRVLVQKDRKAQWVYTGMGVRLAARGSFVTHIPNGGTALSGDELGKTLFNENDPWQKLCKDIEFLAVHAAAVVEDFTGLHLGVLSMDIGLDRSHRPWIIEVNSKPASFNEELIRKKHIKLLHDYFEYLRESAITKS